MTRGVWNASVRIDKLFDKKYNAEYVAGEYDEVAQHPTNNRYISAAFGPGMVTVPAENAFENTVNVVLPTRVLPVFVQLESQVGCVFRRSQATQTDCEMVLLNET